MSTLTMKRNDTVARWSSFFLHLSATVGLLLFCSLVLGNDGAEFEEVANTFQGWVEGNLGKLAAFVAVAVGSIVAAVRKDWSWFFGGVVLAIGIGIVVTIINASFTATI